MPSSAVLVAGAKHVEQAHLLQVSRECKASLGSFWIIWGSEWKSFSTCSMRCRCLQELKSLRRSKQSIVHGGTCPVSPLELKISLDLRSRALHVPTERSHSLPAISRVMNFLVLQSLKIDMEYIAWISWISSIAISLFWSQLESLSGWDSSLKHSLHPSIDQACTKARRTALQHFVRSDRCFVRDSEAVTPA